MKQIKQNLNRLQFAHSSKVFKTLDDIKKHLELGVVEGVSEYQYHDALIGEPMMLLYGDENKPNVVLVLGYENGDSNGNPGKHFYIDFANLEESVKKIEEDTKSNETAISDIKALLEEVIKSCGLTEDGKYNLINAEDEYLKDTETFAEADDALSKAIQKLASLYKLSTEDSETIKWDINSTEEDGTVLKAEVKVPVSLPSKDGAKNIIFNEEIGEYEVHECSKAHVHSPIDLPNSITVGEEGLYMRVALAYDKEKNELAFQVNDDLTSFALSEGKFISEGEYIPNDEELVLKWSNGETACKISMSQLIDEWKFEIDAAKNTGIEVNKETVKEGKDKVTVKLLFAEGANALICKPKVVSNGDTVDEGGLYVSPYAKDYIYDKDKNVVEAIDAVDAKFDAIAEKADKTHEELQKFIAANKVEEEDGSVVVDTTDEGTKLSVAIDGATIKKSDKGALYSTLHIVEIKDSAKGDVRAIYELQDEDGVRHGDQIVDKYSNSDLVGFYLGFEGDHLDNGEIVKTNLGEKALVYVYRMADGSKTLVSVNLKEFLFESEFKDGLEVASNGEVSVKIDTTSEKFLSVSEYGVKLDGVQNAIEDAVDALETKVNENLKAETERATETEKANKKAIEDEVARATQKETEISNKLAETRIKLGYANDEYKAYQADEISDAEKEIVKGENIREDILSVAKYAVKEAVDNAEKHSRLNDAINELIQKDSDLEKGLDELNATVEKLDSDVKKQQIVSTTLDITEGDKTTVEVKLDNSTIQTQHGADVEGTLYVPYVEGYLKHSVKGFEVVGVDEAIAVETKRAIDAEAELKTAVESVTSKAVENADAIAVNKDAITKLTEDTAKQVDGVKAELDGKITAEETRAIAKEDELDAKIQTNADDIDSLEAKVGTLTSTVAKNEVTSQDKSITLSNINGKTDLSVAVDGNTIQKKDGKLYTNLHLASYSVENLSSDIKANVKEAYALYDGNGNLIEGAKILVYKDSSLKNAEFIDQKLRLTYILADGSESVADVDFSSMIVESEHGDGLVVKDGVVNVKIDETSDEYITVSSNGIKLSGVADAIKTVDDKAVANAEAITNHVADVNTKVSELNTNIEASKTAINNLKTTVNSEITNRTNEVTRLDKRINDSVENLKHLIEDSAKTSTDGIDGVKDRLTKAEGDIKTNSDAIANHASSVDGKVGELTEKINANKVAIDNEVTARTTEITRIETQCTNRFDGIKERLGNAEKQINANQVSVSAKEDGFVRVKVEKNENTGAVVTISENGDIASKTALETEVSDRISSVNAVDAKVSQLQKDVVAAKTKVNSKGDGHVFVTSEVDADSGKYVVTVTEDNIASVTGVNSLESVKAEIVGDDTATSQNTIKGLKKYLEGKITSDVENSKVSGINAIEVADKTVKLVINAESDPYLTQDEKGLKLNGVKEAIDELQENLAAQPSYTFGETSTVVVTNNNDTLTYDVKVSATANNTVEKNADGLYVKANTLTYNPTSNTLTFNGNDIQLNAGSVIKSMDYIDGNIVITYLPANSEDVKTVTFDASQLFKALQISNGKTGVELALSTADNGGQLLTATVKVANKTSNMLKLVNGELEVDDARLVEVENGVDTLTDSLALANTEIGNVKTSLELVTTKVNDNATDIGGINQRVSLLETEITDVANLTRTTEALTNKLDEVEGKANVNASEIITAKGLVSQEVADRNTAIADAKRELEGKINTEVSTRSAETARLGESITSLTSGLATEKSDREAAITTLTTSVNTANENLGIVREDVSANKEAIAANKDAIYELRTYHVQVLETQMADLQPRVSVLEEKAKKIDAVETLAKEVDARLTAEIEARTNADTALGARIDTLNQEVNSLKDPNSELVERIEALETDNEELKRQVADLIATVKGLFDDGTYPKGV